MPTKILDDFPDWRAWLEENIDRGCERSVLVDTLTRNGFAATSIDAAAARHLAKRNAARPPVRAAPALVKPDSGRFVLKANTEKLELYLIDDFLSESECADLVAAGDSRLRPSGLTVDVPDSYYRTSKTCDLGLLDHPTVRVVSRRICDTLGIPDDRAEVMQLQKYEVGEEFKRHTDYFEPGTDEYTRFCGGIGNRTWTFMIYLSPVEEGGGTRFFAIDKTIQPKPGTAVVWNSLRPDGTPNPNTMHAGMPVIRGTKCIVTQWFREYAAGTPGA